LSLQGIVCQSLCKTVMAFKIPAPSFNSINKQTNKQTNKNLKCLIFVKFKSITDRKDGFPFINVFLYIYNIF